MGGLAGACRSSVVGCRVSGSECGSAHLRRMRGLGRARIRSSVAGVGFGSMCAFVTDERGRATRCHCLSVGGRRARTRSSVADVGFGVRKCASATDEWPGCGASVRPSRLSGSWRGSVHLRRIARSVMPLLVARAEPVRPWRLSGLWRGSVHLRRMSMGRGARASVRPSRMSGLWRGSVHLRRMKRGPNRPD